MGGESVGGWVVRVWVGGWCVVWVGGWCVVWVGGV